MIGIKSLEFVLPNTLVPVHDLEEVQALNPQGQILFNSLKIDTVSITEDMDNVDLATEAARLALASAALSPNDIDLIIFLQSRAPAFLMSPEAALVQERLGAKKCYSFTVTDLGCANISNALLLAHNYLQLDMKINNILICCGSKPFGRYRYREAVTVIGDGGMGLVVGRTSQNRIIDVKLRTDGRFWDLYKIDYRNMLADEYREVCTSPRYKFELSIASRNNFSELNAEICEENGISHISAYIMQNLSFSAFAFNEDAFKIKFAQSCYENCRKYGHLGSIDVLLNYQVGIKNGEFKTGDVVLVMNNSPVACWSSMLLQV